MEGWKVNESAADWGLVFDTLLLIAFLRADAETPEERRARRAKKLMETLRGTDGFGSTGR